MPRTLTPQEASTISEIAFRALFGNVIRADDLNPLLNALGELHIGPCPLALNAFLSGKYSDFRHDVSGILQHFDPTTNTLKDCFLPRFAK